VKIEATVAYLPPIDLGEHEWVGVILPDGREVTVYSDRIYVATAEDRERKKDGKVIWEARPAARWPHGRTRELPPAVPRAVAGQQAGLPAGKTPRA
jgi:hypothetical protein